VVVPGATRYVWCWTEALWTYGVRIPTFEDDVAGAAHAGQLGMLQFAARLLAENCLTAVFLVTRFPHPLPPPEVRIGAALGEVSDADALRSFRRLVLGSSVVDDVAGVLDDCATVARFTGNVLGSIPRITAREHRFEALAAAVRWLDAVNAIGSGGGQFLATVRATTVPPT
jgi:hypothetical protein